MHLFPGEDPMKTQSRSLQFAVTGALLLGPSASGDLVCGIPHDPEAIEDDLSAQTVGTTVVNPGPNAPPHPITAPPPGIVNPGPVTAPQTMR
jgi:hypothetical protein